MKKLFGLYLFKVSLISSLAINSLSGLMKLNFKTNTVEQS